jgi:hypothetical protein
MDPHDILGIDRDAELLEIKRAYARLLKSNRPDDDAAAFQILQQAYEACLAQRRSRDAGLAHNWEESEEWEGNDSGDPDTDSLPEETSGADDGVLISGDLQALPDEAGRLLVEMMEIAKRDGPAALLAWLHGHESLYLLAFKQEVSDRFLSELDCHALSWQALDVLYGFFNINSAADSRLRADHSARETWERVRADEQFERVRDSATALRTRFLSDRLVHAELFCPPDPVRRWKILLYPSVPRQMRTTMELLLAADPQRAEAAITPGVLEHWMRLTDPGRLDWRRVAVAMLQVIIVTLTLVGLLVAISDFSLAKALTYCAVACMVTCTVWWAWTLLVLGRLAYFRWLNSNFAGGAQSGDPITADPPSMMVLFFTGIGLLACASVAIFDLSLGWLWALYFSGLVSWTAAGTRESEGQRWDAGLMLGAMALLLWLCLQALPGMAEYPCRISRRVARGGDHRDPQPSSGSAPNSKRARCYSTKKPSFFILSTAAVAILVVVV